MTSHKNKKSFVTPQGNPESKDKFLQKHPPKSSMQVSELLREKEEAKSKYTQDISALEANIKTFNERPEPLIDPVTSKPLMWVRNPTQKELESLVPQELWDYRDNPETVPSEVAKKYEDHQFKMMAELVVIPKHDVEWWKANANLPLQLLFQEHLAKIYRDLGIQVANF